MIKAQSQKTNMKPSLNNKFAHLPILKRGKTDYGKATVNALKRDK